MIPDRLIRLVEQQKGRIHRATPETVNKELDALCIPRDSEFGEFFRSYVITYFPSDVSDEELCDLIDPTPEIAAGTKYVRDVWDLSEQYVCLSSIQGEGAYLYDRYAGTVWDFDLALRDDFVGGKQKPRWMSFFDFMIWYLSTPRDI
jgi:hypothetical protein